MKITEDKIKVEDSKQVLPQHITNQPYDLRSVTQMNIDNSDLLKHHNENEELNNIYNIQNSKDINDFKEKAKKSYKNSDSVYYVIMKKNEFIGYICLYDIKWKKNTAKSRLSVKIDNQEIINNVLYMFLYITYNIIGLYIVNIHSLSKNRDNKHLDNFVRDIGGTFDGYRRVPVDNTNKTVKDIHWSITSEEFKNKDSEYKSEISIDKLI